MLGRLFGELSIWKNNLGSKIVLLSLVIATFRPWKSNFLREQFFRWNFPEKLHFYPDQSWKSDQPKFLIFRPAVFPGSGFCVDPKLDLRVGKVKLFSRLLRFAPIGKFFARFFPSCQSPWWGSWLGRGRNEAGCWSGSGSRRGQRETRWKVYLKNKYCLIEKKLFTLGGRS